MPTNSYFPVSTLQEFPSGMIDWLTLRIDSSLLPPNIRQVLIDNTARILKIDKNGEREWESSARENIKSDSHQITIKFGATLEITGSPARVLHGNNVFGSLDIKQCFYQMVEFVQKHFAIRFPIDIKQWKCTRIDVTRNYDMGCLDYVLQAIDALKLVRVGRQKMVAYDTGASWGNGSNFHMGKVYAKGPDLKRNVSSKKAFCTDEELEKSAQLLRLEYSARRHLIQDIKKNSGLDWSNFSESFLIAMHDQYFSRFVTEIEVTDMDNVLELIKSKVGDDFDCIPSTRQATAAYDCYVRCRTMGKRVARSTYPSRSTWFRHLKNLQKAGIKEVDLQSSNVVPLKKRQIVLDNPVACWGDIKLAQGN